MTSASLSASGKRVLEKRVEILKDKLYWICDTMAPSGFDDSFYFCIDRDLTYTPYHNDFGPLHLGNIYKYITEVQRLLTSKTPASTVLYHYTAHRPETRTNSCLLICAFQIIALQVSAEDAWNKFSKQCKVPIEEFIEAGYKPSPYRCSVLDCLRGLEYAIKLGWFNLAKFNLKQYTYYEAVENGDLNWIVPNKFIAFSTPNDTASKKGHKFFTAESFTPILKTLGVKLVVRLNDPLYNESVMIQNGIDHLDVFFDDGSCPEPHHIRKFLSAAELCSGAIGVHCKAGLGRTGTMIGLYLMKHYRFPAPALIGWMRLCRPGMVLGSQQYFLCKMQDQMFLEGSNSRILRGHPPSVIKTMENSAKETKTHHQRNKTPINFYKKEENQADRLIKMKDEHRAQRPKSMAMKIKSTSKGSIYAPPKNRF